MTCNYARFSAVPYREERRLRRFFIVDPVEPVSVAVEAWNEETRSVPSGSEMTFQTTDH
jgi:hypothetical protein